MRGSPHATVSVVIPCYNAETTIAETIDSALAQDVDSRVIVVDDGSTDGSAAILRGYGDRIEALFGPNRGVSAARNGGFQAARGDWIQFVDSDDLLAPGSLGLRLAAAQTEAADMVICDWREFTDGPQGRCEGELRQIDLAALARDPQAAMATHVWAPPAAVLYRRGIVEAIGGFREDLPVIQDARFMFDAAFRNAKVVHSNHIGAGYRVVAGSLSRRDPGQFWRDVLLNAQQIEALWRSRDALEPDRRAALVRIYNQAARGLFSAADPRFFEAAADLRRLGAAPGHAVIAGPLARVVGLKPARALLSLIGKG